MADNEKTRTDESPATEANYEAPKLERLGNLIDLTSGTTVSNM